MTPRVYKRLQILESSGHGNRSGSVGEGCTEATAAAAVPLLMNF